MKKILCLFLSVILAGYLTACMEYEQPKKETESTLSTIAPEQKEETFGLKETAVFKNLKFTATELMESDGKDFFVPEGGNVFVGVKFTIENISDEDQTVSSMLLFNGYVDNVKCEYSLSASCAFEDGTIDGTIAPGKKLIGWYALEVPKNWSSIELEVMPAWLSNNAANFVFTK